ncbi:MAG: single-stranded DNA-binding protein [Deltaproteobacteria bacterium]|nr:MAG: single-stranded DNA-binding protein [Deltaproteobacteria bacterium]
MKNKGMLAKIEKDEREIEKGSDYNKVILMGNLTENPELRYTPNGAAVASLRLAVSHRYRQKNEIKDDVSHFNIVTFGEQAESCAEHLSKGGYILIDGRLQERRWEAEGEQRRAEIEVVASRIYSLGELKKLSSE